MVTIPSLTVELLPADMTNDVLLVVHKATLPGDKDAKATRATLLHDVIREGGAANLTDVTADTLAAPVGTIDTINCATALIIGAKLQRILVGSLALPATLATDTGSTQTVTVTGAVVGDTVLINTDVAATALIIRAHVSAADTVTVITHNPTASPMTVGGTAIVSVLRLVA